jgi:hypothetical protein
MFLLLMAAFVSTSVAGMESASIEYAQSLLAFVSTSFV